MSGQAKRSRSRAASRQRRQFARLLAHVDRPRLAKRIEHLTRAVVGGVVVYDRAEAILAGSRFDVHAARELAEEMICYGVHRHRVRKRHELDRRGRQRAHPVCDWAETFPGKPWPHLAEDPDARLGHRLLDMLDGRCWWAASARGAEGMGRRVPACLRFLASGSPRSPFRA